jgi:hypothetical protein
MNGVQKWRAWLSSGGVDAAWAMAELERKIDELQQNMTTLKQREVDVKAENEVLVATLRATVALLTEAGVIDEQSLSRRVDEIIADGRTAAKPAPKLPRGGSPYRDGLPPLTAPAPAEVVCADCGRTFPLERTDVVGYGTGYRCLPCSAGSDVSGHVERALETAVAKGRAASLVDQDVARFANHARDDKD